MHLIDLLSSPLISLLIYQLQIHQLEA